MTLIEKYLRAVAAQLPVDARDDVVAELRDDLMSRIEAREAELGRALDEAETEAVLRELGHPLIVAARFGAGPLHVVGPELYPWWAFAVKAALAVMAVITLVGALVRVLSGDADVSQAIGQAIGGLFWSGMGVVGLITVAGFIIERQKEKPAFLTQWRVRDLGLFEFSLFSGWFERTIRTADAPVAAGRSISLAPVNRLSPTAGAMGSAIGWGVFLLWWSGVLGLGFRFEDLGGRAVRDGVDYAALMVELGRVIYWPVLFFAAARTVFHLLRAATGSPVRFTALGDAVFSIVSLGFISWFWLHSPFSALIRVDDIGAFIDRVADMGASGDYAVPTIIMMATAFAFVVEMFNLLGALWRLARGR